MLQRWVNVDFDFFVLSLLVNYYQTPACPNLYSEDTSFQGTFALVLRVSSKIIEVSLYKSSALTTWPLYLCIELTSPSLDSSHNHIVSYIPRTHITENLQYLHEASDPILDLVQLGFYLLAIFCLHTAFYFTL